MRAQRLVFLLLVVAAWGLGGAWCPWAPGVPAAAAADLPDVGSRQPARSLLGGAYPIEPRISFHAALLHWLDSIAALNGPGMTAGKTVEAHRLEYQERIGALDGESIRALRRYADLRVRFAERHGGSAAALTDAFFDSPTLEVALARAGELLDESSLAELRASLEHFTPGYRRIWRDGSAPRSFVRRVESAPERPAVRDFLVDLARFYGVDASAHPSPRLVLAPVRAGHGTHAQALGRNLLIEVRAGESLADQVGPLVHENAHWLYGNVAAERRERLRERAARFSPAGPEAFRLLQEALPTALAQGLAEERFRARWSPSTRWYHVAEVDRYAKQLFPVVKRALADGRTLDESLLRELVEAYRP